MNVIMYADEATSSSRSRPLWCASPLPDRGQGIPDIPLAMQEGYSTATSAMRERGFGAGLGCRTSRRTPTASEIESTPA